MVTSKAFQKRAYKAEDWITAEEASKLFGITPKSLGNMVWAGKIPARYISIGIGGKKFFYRPGLLGFDN